jgi:hypothetical protein
MPRTRQALRSEIPLDTLGKVADRGYRPFGSCLDCARRFRYELGARKQPSQCGIDLGALVAERGRDCPIVGMKDSRYQLSREIEALKRVAERLRADARRLPR